MRKIIALLLCIFLLPCVLAAQAADITKIIQGNQLTEEALQIFGKELPQGGTLTVSVDSQQIPAASFSTVAEQEIPVTVYCLVDTSTSMSKSQIQQQKDVLNTISSRMGANDNMVIATLGSTMTESQRLTSMDARKTAIDTITREGSSTNLYKAVVDAIQSLKIKVEYAPKRCLVILSDGNNDGADSTTELQAIDAIRAAGLPVYGVATLGDFPSDYSQKLGNHVIRMAQESVGGLGFVPGRETLTAANAGESIWKSIQNGSVFSVSLSDIDSRSNAASIRIGYATADSKFEDSTTVDLSGVPVIAPETVPETTDIPTEETATEDEEENGKQIISILLPAAGVGVIILAGVVWLLLSRKKKQAVVQTVTDYKPENPTPELSAVTTSASEPTVSFTESLENNSPDVMIHLIGIMHPDVRCSFGLISHKQQTLGRSSKADIIVNAQDNQLSGRHCVVEWDGNNLYLQDTGSTNGSSLDGIPIAPGTWHRVGDGAKLTIGEYEYRVTIRKQ